MPAKRSDPEQEAVELLRKTDKVRAQELIRLIHEVNPTGLGLAPEVERRRYELKSRLQSVLIRRFREDLTFKPVPGADGVVDVRYRPQDRDACHALVLALDEDARSIVRFAIDAGETTPPPLSSSEAPPSSDRRKKSFSSRAIATTSTSTDWRELVRLGAEALEAYDFDRTRQLLEDALELSDGAEGPAVALLELFVDHLAAYAEALGLEDRLSSNAERSPNVRALLAVAAAQAGQRELARRWLTGAEGSRAVDTCILLARRALESGDLEEADRSLADARKRAAAHPELPLVGAEIAKARATSRRPAEEELSALASRGDANDSDVERRARALLEAWPDSAIGRQVLRQIEVRRQQTEAENLRKDGAEALARGELERAARLWTSAVELGAQGLEGELRELRARLTERAVDARVEEVSASLLPELSTRGLLRYAECEQPVRDRIRQRTALPELEWLEALGRPANAREAEQFAAAIVALSRAVGRTDASDGSPGPDEALTMLTPHEQVLRRLRQGREVLESARASHRKERAEAAERALDAARGALDAGRGVEALAMLEQLLHGVPSNLRARVEDLRAAAADAARMQRLLDRVDADIQAGRLFDALNALREVDEHNVGEVLRGRLDQRRREVRAAAATALRLEVRRDIREAAPEFANAKLRGQLGHWLDETGGAFYWVFGHEQWLFIERFAPGDARAQTVASLRVPEAMSFLEGHLNRDVLVICSNRGAVLELSSSDWTVRSWQGSSGFVGSEEIVDNVLAVPGSRWLWLSVRESPDAPERLRIVDVDKRRVQRQFDLEAVAHLLTGGVTGPRIFAQDFIASGKLFALNGSVEGALPPGFEEVARVPGSDRLLGVRRTEDDDAEDGEALELVLVSSTGDVLARRPLENAWADLQRALGSSRSSGLSYLLHDTEERSFRSLMAFSVEGNVISAEWGTAVHANSALIQNIDGERVALVVPVEEGARVVPLGREEPGVPLAGTARWSPWRRLPVATGELFCGRPRTPDDASQVVNPVLAEQEPQRRRALLREALQRWERDPDALFGIARMFEHGPGADLRSDVVEFARQRHPRAPATRLHEAEAAYARRDWGAVRTLTEGLDLTGLDNRVRAHALHLLALAQYHQGAPTDALATFTKAAAIEGDSCEVKQWVEWLTLLTKADITSEPGEMAELLRAIRSADACASAGDHAGALRVLDVATVWSAFELQSLARLAKAALTVLGATSRDVYRKRLILAAFVEQAERQTSPLFTKSVPLGPETWSEDRIAEIAAEARGWLAEHGGR